MVLLVLQRPSFWSVIVVDCMWFMRMCYCLRVHFNWFAFTTKLYKIRVNFKKQRKYNLDCNLVFQLQVGMQVKDMLQTVRFGSSSMLVRSYNSKKIDDIIWLKIKLFFSRLRTNHTPPKPGTKLEFFLGDQLYVNDLHWCPYFRH
jgi:hypothetical protein